MTDEKPTPESVAAAVARALLGAKPRDGDPRKKQPKRKPQKSSR